MVLGSCQGAGGVGGSSCGGERRAVGLWGWGAGWARPLGCLQPCEVPGPVLGTSWLSPGSLGMGGCRDLGGVCGVVTGPGVH